MGRKRLTTKCHYEASIMLWRLINEDDYIPDYIDWNILPEHIEILKLFIINGMNANEIQSSGLIISKRKKPMCQDMILLWIHKYIPFLEYDEKSSNAKRNKDPNETKAHRKLAKTLPKTHCACCGSTEKLELDHIWTYDKGGRAEESNVQWLCHKCHVKKTNQERKEFGWVIPSHKKK